MAELMGNLRRTNYLGNFTLSDVGSEVVVCGWVQKRRNLGSLIFIDLRDKTGISQIVFDSSIDATLFEKANSLRTEFVAMVKGTVRERENKTDKIKTGAIEILASDLKVLAEADTTPFEIVDNTDVNELLRLKYRYLDLRRPTLQNNLFVP